MIKLLDILQEIIEGTCGYTTDTKTGKKLNTPGGLEEADPKTGTGKKPKGSDRRLYTDENPAEGWLDWHEETKNNTSTKLNIADMEYDLTYHLADLRMMPMETMVLDESQITFGYSFNIDSEFIERYNKAKKALGSDEVKIQALFNGEGDKGIYFTLGGKTSHDDKISFQTPNAEMELPSSEFQYNANYLFEIFTENKGAEGIGYFDENGILKLEFNTENSIKSTYYLPPKN